MSVPLFALWILVAAPQQPAEVPVAPKKETPAATEEKKDPAKPSENTDIKLPKDDELSLPKPKEKAPPKKITRRAPPKRQVISEKIVDRDTLEKPKAEPSRFTLGLQLFMGYNYTKSDDESLKGNRFDLERSYITLGFRAHDKVSAHLTTDLMRNGAFGYVGGEYKLLMKYAWLEFKDVIPGMQGNNILAGQVENNWNRFREKTTGIRYMVRTPLQAYAFTQEGDLGIWARGTILDESFHYAVGIGNGSGTYASEFDQGKSVDLLGAFSIKVPVPIQFALYFRGQLNDNTDPAVDKKVASLTTAGSMDVTYDIFRFGFEGFYYTYNDTIISGTETIDINHNFYGTSVYLTVAPTKKLKGFLRSDLLWYTHGTATDDSAKYNTQVFLGGAGYEIFKNFWLGASVSFRRVDGIEIITKNTKASDGYYNAPSLTTTWNMTRDKETTFTIHTKFIY